MTNKQSSSESSSPEPWTLPPLPGTLLVFTDHHNDCYMALELTCHVYRGLGSVSAGEVGGFAGIAMCCAGASSKGLTRDIHSPFLLNICFHFTSV